MKDFVIAALIGIMVLTMVFLSIVIVFKIVFKRDNKNEKNVDHTLVQIDDATGSWSHCDVFYDKDTRIMYLVNYHGGITVMVNPDGSPRLYKEDNDD